MLVIFIFLFFALTNAINLHNIKEYEFTQNEMLSWLAEIEQKKWVNVDQYQINQYANFLPNQYDRLKFLANTKPEKIEFNMTYIKMYELKETFQKIYGNGNANINGNGVFASFTNNFYFDIVFKRGEEQNMNQFYRRYIERRQLEKKFNATVVNIFGSEVENPMELLDLKITALYEELAKTI